MFSEGIFFFFPLLVKVVKLLTDGLKGQLIYCLTDLLTNKPSDWPSELDGIKKLLGHANTAKPPPPQGAMEWHRHHAHV